MENEKKTENSLMFFHVVDKNDIIYSFDSTSNRERALMKAIINIQKRHDISLMLMTLIKYAKVTKGSECKAWKVFSSTIDDEYDCIHLVVHLSSSLLKTHVVLHWQKGWKEKREKNLQHTTNATVLCIHPSNLATTCHQNIKRHEMKNCKESKNLTLKIN